MSKIPNWDLLSQKPKKKGQMCPNIQNLKPCMGKRYHKKVNKPMLDVKKEIKMK